MRFSIITPTLQRPSLIKCCASVNEQVHQDWQHIVYVDDEDFDTHQIDSVRDKRREFCWDRCKYGNFGNGPRHWAWKETTGDYLIYLDDDNFFTHPRALSDIEICLMSCNEPDWAIFPIIRFGHRFFSDNPGVCHTDSANMVIKREIGQWPNRDEYTLDGIFAEQLKAKYAFATFPKCNPIITVPVQGKGL